MSEFRFELSQQEKDYLKDLVRLSILGRLKPGGGPASPPAPPTEILRRELGAFVTLKRAGRLRGCIGKVQGSGELYRTIWEMARAAAFKDPRFPPLEASEFKGLDIEVSVLGPVTACPDPELVEIGRHGLIMSRDRRAGLLLPQVAVQWKWDRRTFLAQTCLKAGLPPEAWRDEETAISWFEAEVF
ncbi:MAG: AmmeMemoRadiSam system protein A [Desulfovibrionaceae bacterium]|nr:AmmeMemoRadiSam system protein A [Desulfovibrionaceae bacterium]